MTRVRLTPGVIEDLDRIVDHLHRHEIDGADARAGEIVSAFDVLADNPLIGRPAGDDKLELIIGRGSGRHIALYRFLSLINIVLIVTIRAQVETEFARP